MLRPQWKDSNSSHSYQSKCRTFWSWQLFGSMSSFTPQIFLFHLLFLWFCVAYFEIILSCHSDFSSNTTGAPINQECISQNAEIVFSPWPALSYFPFLQRGIQFFVKRAKWEVMHTACASIRSKMADVQQRWLQLNGASFGSFRVLDIKQVMWAAFWSRAEMICITGSNIYICHWPIKVSGCCETRKQLVMRCLH